MANVHRIGDYRANDNERAPLLGRRPNVVPFISIQVLLFPLR